MAVHLKSPTFKYLVLLEMTSGVYLLPVELLLMIFARLRKQDLAALRLTSKHIDDVVSQIYLESDTIALRRQTLVHLGTIIWHPGLKRRVGRVTLDVSQFDDRATENEVYAQRLIARLEKSWKTTFVMRASIIIPSRWFVCFANKPAKRVCFETKKNLWSLRLA